MAMIGHPIHNDHRYTYGHAAQVGLCRGRRQGGRAKRENPCAVYDDSACSSEAEAEECVAAELDASEAEVRPSRNQRDRNGRFSHSVVSACRALQTLSEPVPPPRTVPGVFKRLSELFLPLTEQTMHASILMAYCMVLGHPIYRIAGRGHLPASYHPYHMT